jgi:replicative DNA helicase
MNIENVILSELLSNQDFYERTIAYIKPEYFHEYADKIIFEEIVKYSIKYSSAPSKDALSIQLEHRDDLNENQYTAATDTLSDLTSSDHEYDWLIDSTDKFCRDKAVYNGVMKAIEIIDDESGQRGGIPDLLSDALAVSLDSHVGHDWNDDVDSRFEFYHKTEERIPCDIDYLNTATKGGIPNKTLNIILAGINVGKSLALCHLSASYMAQGKNVLYITMEMAEERIAERIDANLLNISLNDIENLSEDEYKSKFKRAIKNIKGRLIVKEYPTTGASANNFRSLLKELAIKKKFKPDAIFIDYLGICASSRFSGGSENSYHYVKAIAEELRGLAVENNVPIWSAAQVNRAGFSDTDPDMTATAESFGLPATADFMISMTTSEELQQLGQIKFKVLKNRYSDYKKAFVTGIDYPHMKLINLDSSASSSLTENIKSTIAKKPEFNKKRFEGLIA